MLGIMPSVPRTRPRPELGPQRHPGAAVALPRPAFWPRLLALAVGLASFTRLPSFTQPFWNPDEGFLATQARMLAAGGTLYETVVDRKPPLLPWLYEAAFALFGDRSLWPLRVAAILAQVVTAVLLAAVARRRWGDRAGRAAPVLYLLVSIGLNPQDGQAANFEVFLLPWTAAALWCADRARWYGAGLAVAGALLTKQTGGAALLPVLCLLRYAPGGRRRAAVLLSAGLAGPFVLVACLTEPRRLLFWTVTGSGAYADVAGSVLTAAGRAAGNTALVAAACAGLLLPLLRCRPDRATGLWPWLGASAVGVAVGFHFFGHYYAQILPPLALPAAGALARLPAGATRRSLLLCGVSCGAFWGWGLVAQPPDLPHARGVVAAVRARTEPREPVLIWGMHPEQYWLADRAPGSRFLTAGLLTNYSGGRGPARVGPAHAVPGTWPTFRRELAARPPALVVDDSRGAPYAPSRTPALRALLHSRYERSGVADGAVLYVRRAG
ncbi:glycosyltransferase family 39 protein [Streptomyces sp. NPDC003077]|uniref:ArnT family glycosyltransferase n=1 Tax=Streptomyces sp. NPDC003077 TaxID=3154443 RepID=UPI0033A2A89A